MYINFRNIIVFLYFFVRFLFFSYFLSSRIITLLTPCTSILCTCKLLFSVGLNLIIYRQCTEFMVSRSSSVSIVTQLRAGRREFEARQGQGIFFSSPPRPD